MDNLISILEKETATLKALYLEQTKSWAEKKFNTCEIRKTWKTKEWCEYLKLEPKLCGDFGAQYWEFPTNFHNTSKARDFDNAKKEVRKTLEQGCEAYVAKALANAENHYTDSLLKLVKRIQDKELIQENLTVTTSHIGVNINITLTDGAKTVKAWTIIAEGAIQKPHYRYLVK